MGMCKIQAPGHKCPKFGCLDEKPLLKQGVVILVFCLCLPGGIKKGAMLPPCVAGEWPGSFYLCLGFFGMGLGSGPCPVWC